MLQYLHSLSFLFLTVISSSDVKVLVARLEARYRSAGTLQATFLERYTENGRVVRVEAGIAYFRRPGKMRWEYESPEKICSSSTASRLGSTFRRTTPSRVFPRRRARIGGLLWHCLQER